MKQTTDIKNSASNIISFKKYKEKKSDEVTSTIAAIIAAIVDVTSSDFFSLYFLNEIILDAEFLIPVVCFINYAP